MKPVPFWLLPNVLSLDAPLVAVAWQALLAQISGTPLRPAGRIILFFTVWLIYIADRLLDARHPPPPWEPARHQFYRRHRHAATAWALAILVVDVAWILFELQAPVLRTGLVAFAGVALYFVLLHGTRLAFPKEIVVAALFTCGTFLVAFTRAPQPATLLPAALLFFLLCLANLVAIEYWESGGGLGLGRWFLWWVPWIAVAAILLFPGPWGWAISWAATGLCLVYALAGRLSEPARRVLVDAVLLAPPLLML